MPRSRSPVTGNRDQGIGLSRCIAARWMAHPEESIPGHCDAGGDSGVDQVDEGIDFLCRIPFAKSREREPRHCFP